MTRIEKSLLQAHFRSVNYCHYNFVEHRTLIYVSGSFFCLNIFRIKKDIRSWTNNCPCLMSYTICLIN
ncbi:hypothetical protein C7R28_06945 [Staphylococcus aureus]|nr:hypothetical protein C7R28_06945 [Staphylococcus aureus]